jgi:hypothetical protein
MSIKTRRFFYAPLNREIVFVAGVQYKDLLKEEPAWHYQSIQGKELSVVKASLPDWEQIFQDLDKEGVSKETHPRELVHELYEMAVLVNPQLKWV